MHAYNTIMFGNAITFAYFVRQLSLEHVLGPYIPNSIVCGPTVVPSSAQHSPPASKDNRSAYPCAPGSLRKAFDSKHYLSINKQHTLT